MQQLPLQSLVAVWIKPLQVHFVLYGEDMWMPRVLPVKRREYLQILKENLRGMLSPPDP